MVPLLLTLDLALEIYSYILIANIIYSWLYTFNIINPRNKFVDTIGIALYRLTDPILKPIRRILPNLGMIDISPIIVFLVIYFLRSTIRWFILD